MPTNKTKSPFATPFKSAINRGTPCCVAVENIAKRTGKSPNTIFQSLFKAGLCHRQKIAGQWVYWPCEWPGKSSATNMKNCQGNMWQWFVDWCLCCGFCTPEQLAKKCGSQTEFMTYCRKFFGKQFTPGTTGKSRKSKPKSGRSYKFPSAKSGSTGRKYRKAA